MSFTILANGSVEDVRIVQSQRRLAARPRRPAVGPLRRAVRPASQGLWNQPLYDPGDLPAPRRSRTAARAGRSSCWPPRACRRPRRSSRPGASPHHRDHGRQQPAFRGARLRARAAATRPAARPAARSRRCCAATWPSRGSSASSRRTCSRAIPPLNPESPNYTDWQGIGANVLVVTRAQVTAGELAVEATVHAVDSRPDASSPSATRAARTTRASSPTRSRTRSWPPRSSEGWRARSSPSSPTATQQRAAPEQGDLHHGLRRLQPAPRDRQPLASTSCPPGAPTAARSPTSPTARASPTSSWPPSSRAAART